MEVEIIGYIASVVGTFMMLPQVILGIRNKDMNSVSYGMVYMYIGNCILWSVYGFGINSYPVIVANGIGFFIGLLQLSLKILYSK